jgi:hypothetical protein
LADDKYANAELSTFLDYSFDNLAGGVTAVTEVPVSLLKNDEDRSFAATFG